MNSLKTCRVRGVRRLFRRRGAVILLAAFLIVPLLGVLAFAVDIGYIANVQTELKRATDAGALAGAAELVRGTELAYTMGRQFTELNQVGSRGLTGGDVTVELGHWNEGMNAFSVAANRPSAVRVLARRSDQPLFFGGLMGRNSFTTQTESIAVYRPRDIMVVLDYSASMNDDSELGSIDRPGLSRAMIESNIATIYQELGSPINGNMTFAPRYLTLKGQPASGSIPQVTVTFRATDVQVTSTMDLSNVVLCNRSIYGNETTEKFEGLTGRSGTFSFSDKRRIDTVWVKSGSNLSADGDGYGERFDDNYANIKAAFNLGAYPYPGGSWNGYIDYMKRTHDYWRNATAINRAGYTKQYGYLTWVNYLLEERFSYADTPVLWKTSEQPLQAVKDASSVFFSYMQEVNTDDRLGLVIYNGPTATAKLEMPLGENAADCGVIVSQRQAGHYDAYTNIGAGIKFGVDELVNNARPGALRLIVLMTDGQANRPTDVATAATYVREQSQRATDAQIPIVTISLGSGADTAIMEEVATTTGGIHFNVPGGRNASEYEAELKDIFRKIADDRPLKLVK